MTCVTSRRHIALHCKEIKTSKYQNPLNLSFGTPVPVRSFFLFCLKCWFKTFCPSVKSEEVELPRPRPRGLESERVRPHVLMPPPPFPRGPGYNNPGESQQLMPPPATLPLPREGVKKPSNHLESQLMPPPAVIPCEPPVTMRQVGDLMSSSLRQGKQKEEIGKTR